jgi:biopolymer transport protein ExbD
MHYLLEVCLAANLAVTPWIAATSGSPPRNSSLEASGKNRGEEKITRATPQEAEEGISVELPATRNARAMPEADREDALIVTLTADGRLYRGVNPVSPAALIEEVKASLSDRADKKLYIKADARTRYANVEKVLDGVRAAGVLAPILLTSQRDWSKSDTLVAPRGFPVLVVPPFSASSEPAVFELLDSGQGWPTLEINHQNIHWTAFETTLSRLLANRAEKVVLVKADARLPFALIVDIGDRCRSMGATVGLVVPGR